MKDLRCEDCGQPDCTCPEPPESLRYCPLDHDYTDDCGECEMCPEPSITLSKFRQGLVDTAMLPVVILAAIAILWASQWILLSWLIPAFWIMKNVFLGWL